MGEAANDAAVWIPAFAGMTSWREAGASSQRRTEWLIPDDPSVTHQPALLLRRARILEDLSIKRLSKKAKKGMRGWPVATIAFYGPNSSRATKVAVGIVPAKNFEVEEMRNWKVDRGDIRADPEIAREILAHIEQHEALSVVMTDGIIGCPHQEGIDYEGEWRPDPACEFWHGRHRFTGERVH
jgi:hypothetical protein